MRLTFIGHGHVGGALADHLQRLGHDVTIAARDATSPKLAPLLDRNPQLAVAESSVAVRDADIIFLATPFMAHAEVLPPLADALAGKILVDCTNPVGPKVSHGLGSTTSGTETIQGMLPRTMVVKAFTIYGYENFEDNRFPEANVRPVMMYCGDDASAKTTIGTLIDALGWEPLDVGGASQALHLEHMTLLWVKMVRMGGRSPHTVWARLTR
jgi:predicted dinucleotide-binding enzyme